MILHLVPAATWAELADAATYTPESLTTEGFVHCSGDDDVMLAVANTFYREVGEVLVLSIDEHELTADVRWEPPAPPPATGSRVTRFPHVYGPLDLAAVVGVRRLVRDDTGCFVRYESA